MSGIYIDCEKLKMEIARQGYTQKDYAGRAKISEATLSHYRGYKSVTVRTLAKLSNALGVPASDFVVRKEDVIERSGGIRKRLQMAAVQGLTAEVEAYTRQLNQLDRLAQAVE